MTMRELAEEAECSLEFANHFWLATGFPQANPDEVMFTDLDLKALRTWLKLVESGQISKSTSQTLMRAQSHLNDRLVLWQLEALVMEYQKKYDLDDTSARLVALDKIEQYLDLLESQVRYAWRRQFSALLLNTNKEVGLKRREKDDPSAYPLQRAMGFVDMVSFTRRSGTMTAHALANLVQTFDEVSRMVITSRGGRVVKTIGDAVLFVANEVLVAADIVCALLEQLQSQTDMLPVRASLVHGGVVSRAGDIFGPPVNLASRLADVSNPGSILIDHQTAKAITQLDQHHSFEVAAQETVKLHGFGQVETWSLERRTVLGRQ